MKQLVTASAVVLAAILGPASPALAAPPHGDGGHVHHVDAGNGGCVQIDAVAFHAVARGLHKGANASGADRGPSHGPCN